MSQTRSVFTSGQLAKIFQVAPRTVGKWIDTKALKGYRLPNSRDRRVTKEDAVAFSLVHGFPSFMTEALHNQPAVGQIVLPKDYGSKPAMKSESEGVA